jgi:hypothetical protein
MGDPVMAGKFTLHIEAGATLRLMLKSTYDTGTLDDDGNPVYTAYDLTDATITMQIREHTGTAVLAEVSTDDGGVTLGDDNEITIVLTAEQTTSLRRGRYDILAEFPSGDTKRLLEGPVSVSPRITEETTDG